MALAVFFGVFFVFFLISLLSDLWIVIVSLGAATLGYFIPTIYPEVQKLSIEIKVLESLGMTLPAQPTASSYYLLGIFLVCTGVLLCLPALPFSATYRQLLGANKISKQDEAYIQWVVKEEVERVKKSLADKS
jgi:hypothetical protein